MTFTKIARLLGLHERTVRDAYRRGVRKLRQRDDCSITIPTLCACAEDDHPGLQAGSAECDREFMSRYAMRTKSTTPPEGR